MSIELAISPMIAPRGLRWRTNIWSSTGKVSRELPCDSPPNRRRSSDQVRLSATSNSYMLFDSYALYSVGCRSGSRSINFAAVAE
jgi:hypothetical protein